MEWLCQKESNACVNLVDFSASFRQVRVLQQAFLFVLNIYVGAVLCKRKKERVQN